MPRTGFAIVLLLGLLLVGTVTAKGVSKKQVQKALSVYFDEDSSREERDNAAKRLKAANPILLQAPLKKELANEDHRGSALRLATAYRVPGLFSTMKKYIEGDYESAVIEYMLLLQDKGAVAFVAKRWKGSATDTESFKYVSSALKKYSADLAAIELFYKEMTDKKADPDRRKDALPILRFQLGLTPWVTQDELAKDWKSLLAAYKADVKKFKITGVALSESEGLKLEGKVTRRGANYRLQPGASLKFPAPAAWDSGSFTVTVWVRVIEGEGCSVSLASNEGAWEPILQKKKWLLVASEDEEYTLPAKIGAWTRIGFECRPDPNPMLRGMPGKRTCEVRINGKTMMGWNRAGLQGYGTLHGDMEALTILAGQTTIVVGGLQRSR